MKKSLLLFLSLCFLGCSENKQDLNLKNIGVVSEFQFDSKNKLNKRILDDSFKSILGESDLYSRNGEYWENLDFNLYSLCVTHSKKIKSIFVIKEIQMIDGELSELYLIKITDDNNLVSIKKIGKHESMANCESDFVLKIHKSAAEITQNEICEMGSQSDDENDETTKTSSEKIRIDLND